MKATVPRLVGLPLRIACDLLSSALGAPLRRSLGGMVVERKLALVDLEAEGHPPPMGAPPAYRPGAAR